jgi:hypothetical protein
VGAPSGPGALTSSQPGSSPGCKLNLFHQKRFHWYSKTPPRHPVLCTFYTQIMHSATLLISLKPGRKNSVQKRISPLTHRRRSVHYDSGSKRFEGERAWREVANLERRSVLRRLKIIAGRGAKEDRATRKSKVCRPGSSVVLRSRGIERSQRGVGVGKQAVNSETGTGNGLRR